MICPYRKRVVKKELEYEQREITYEEYMPCYEQLCPLYSPETHYDNVIVHECCQRAGQEGKAVKE